MSNSKKVFIADDEADILDILTLMLRAQNYEVNSSTDPERVFSLADKDLPDIILLDIWMAGADGRDICKRLKQKENTKNIPVIFISANSNIVEITTECNAQGYIAKPFEMMDMLSIIKNTLEKNTSSS